MVKKGRAGGMLTFSIRVDVSVGKVSLAGDFTDWQPLRMRRRNDVFSVTVPVGPGTHEYKFVVDGRWQTDPDHSDCAVGSYNTLNSIVIVEAEEHSNAVPESM